MKSIQQIIIKNFKAFQEEFVLDLNGKNCLIYGGNGAGKSSLFWALYTFLQSSSKNDIGIQKYFKKYSNGDSTTYESLRNIFVDDAEDSYIKIKFENRSEDCISINSITTNKSEDAYIKELNLASDFINYKFLSNFYRGTHKSELNLWNIFEHDIFPLLQDDHNNSLWDKWNNILSPICQYDGRELQRGNSTRKESRKRVQIYSDIQRINEDIIKLLSDITDFANDCLKKHFFGDKDFLRIHLKFTNQFEFERLRIKDFWRNEAHHSDHLKIKLCIELVKEDGTTTMIERPHSFLNEAQLTRIAIAIRIGALRTRLQATENKILVLDDMLISLDMSNRMEVIKIILNVNKDPDLKFFDEFQKIILTHDKGFYELIKDYTFEKDWEYYKLEKKENSNTAPILKSEEDRVKRALKFIEKGEFDLAGIELRKETESLLNKYLKLLNNIPKDGEFEPLMNKLNNAINNSMLEDIQSFKRVFRQNIPLDLVKKIDKIDSDTTLTIKEKGILTHLKTNVFKFLIKQYELKEDINQELLNIKSILKRIMNPSAHASLIPLYERELRDAIDNIQKLKDHLNKI